MLVVASDRVVEDSNVENEASLLNSEFQPKPQSGEDFSPYV